MTWSRAARTGTFSSISLAALIVALSAAPAQVSAAAAAVPASGQHVRESFGFSANGAGRKQPLHYSRTWGVPLTAQEESELQRRSTLQPNLTALESRLRRVLGDDGFASLHLRVAPVAPVIVSITTAQGVATAKRVALASLPPRTPFQVRVVRFSVRQLDRAMAVERASFDSLRRRGAVLLSTVPNVEANRIDVTLAASVSPSAADVVVATFGPIARVNYAKRPPKALNDRFAAYPHVRAGVNITNFFGRCTAGFNARSNPSGSYYVLTAGHCGSTGESWYNGGGSNGISTPANSIGRVGTDKFLGNGTTDCDCLGIGPISTGQATNGVYLTATTVRSIINVATAPVAPGTPTCFSGVSTDAVFCGTQTAGYASFYYPDDNEHLTFQGLTTEPSIVGDSGSPVYNGQTAYGILSGGDSFGATIYTYASFAQREINVSVLRSQP